MDRALGLERADNESKAGAAGVEMGEVCIKRAPSPLPKTLSPPPRPSSDAHQRPPAYCYLLAFIACLNSCNLG